MSRIILIMVLTSASWGASDWQQQLQNEMLENWLQLGGNPDNSSISLVSVNPAYQLPECQDSPEFETARPLAPGRNGVTIRCQSPWWQQFVAIELHVEQRVAILTQAVNAGDPVGNDSIHFAVQDLGSLPQGYITTTEQLQQQEFRRNLRAGTVLSPDMLRAREVIQRGDRVRMLLSRGTIRIEARAEALGDGRLGESLRVRNLRSGKIVSAIVVAPGEVEIR